jgi:perosamine synthetase
MERLKEQPKDTTHFIPLSEPFIGEAEQKYLDECVRTGWLSSAGPFVEKFETAVAKYSGVRYAVSTSSGTAALHIALMVAGIKPDEEVLVPSLTFIASANAIRYVGAWCVFRRD